MKNNIKHPIYLLFLVSVVLSACSADDSSIAEENKLQGAQEEQKNTLSPQLNDSTLSVLGTIEVTPDAIAHVHSPVNGIIKQLYVKDGEYVKSGQKLVSIQHQDIIKLQESYLKSQADYQLFEKEYNRKKPLFESNMISEKEFLEAKNTYLTSKAEFESNKNQLELLGLAKGDIEEGILSSSLIIKAPIEGFITHVSVNTGTHTLQDLNLFEIVNDSKKFLRLKIFSNDLTHVKKGQQIAFHFGDDEQLFTGTIDRIGKMVDASDKSIDVFVELNQSYEELVVGSTVFAKIKL